MKLECIPLLFSVCKVEDFSLVDLNDAFCFIGKTDEECSLVCRTERVPSNVISREDGWRAFRVCGPLDFSLVGILAEIANVLARREISIFAVSTYNTDYILTKGEQFEIAVRVLREAGYEID